MVSCSLANQHKKTKDSPRGSFLLYTALYMQEVESIFDRIVPLEQVNWNAVKLIMESYAEKYPDETLGCMEYVRQLKESKDNQYASAGSQRHVYELPSRLHKALSIKFPKLFDGENLIEFLKLYPGFQVADKL